MKSAKHWKLSDDKTTIEHVGQPKYEFGVKRVAEEGKQEWISQLEEKTWVSPESLAELSVLLDSVLKDTLKDS